MAGSKCLRLIPWVVVLVLLASCSPAAVAPPTSQPTAVPTPGELDQAPDVTLADDGKTIDLRVGQRFLLNLGAEYSWTVTIDDQSIASRVVNILVIRGAQGVYEAHQAGQTTLTAAGDPVCRSDKPPCAVPSRQFRIQIVVH